MTGINYDYNPTTGRYEEMSNVQSDYYATLECDDCGKPMDPGGITYWDGSVESMRCSTCRKHLASERQKAKEDLDEIDRILNEA